MRALGIFIRGYYHLWFMFMITGLYMLFPFAKKIIESKFLTKYFLLLALIFAFLIPQSVNIISLFSEKYGAFAAAISSNFNMNFVMGFTGYFILGYVLNTADISQRYERIIYFAGILGFVSTIILSATASMIKHEAIGIFYDNATINVLCESMAVFVFFRKHFSINTKLIRRLSQYSFGAYLVHAAFIPLVNKYCGLNTLSFNPIFSVPVISVIVFVFSFTVSWILNHVPGLNKYIV